MQALPSYAQLRRKATDSPVVDRMRADLLADPQAPARNAPPVGLADFNRNLQRGEVCYDCHPDRRAFSLDQPSLLALRPATVDHAKLQSHLERGFDLAVRDADPTARGQLADAYAKRIEGERPDPLNRWSGRETHRDALAASGKLRTKEAQRLEAAAEAPDLSPEERAARLDQASHLRTRTFSQDDQRRADAILETDPNHLSFNDAQTAMQLATDHRAVNEGDYDPRTGLPRRADPDVFLRPDEANAMFNADRYELQRSLREARLNHPLAGEKCYDCHPDPHPSPVDFNGFDAMRRGRNGRGDSDAFARLQSLLREPGSPDTRQQPPLDPTQRTIRTYLGEHQPDLAPGTPQYAAEVSRLERENQITSAIHANPRDPRSYLRHPGRSLNADQQRQVDESTRAYQARELERRAKPRVEALAQEYQRHDWGHDSPFYGVDRAAFLQDVNDKDPSKVSRYDAFRALSELDGFRRDNPDVFAAQAGNFEASRAAGSDLYYRDVDAMRAAELDPSDVAARTKLILEDPNNPLAYLKTPLNELSNADHRTATHDYTRYGVEKLERKMREQVLDGVGQEVSRLDRHFERMLDEQGFIGTPANWAKNNWGSPNGLLFDSNLGSDAVKDTIRDAYQARQQLADLKSFQGSHAEFITAYRDRIGTMQRSLHDVQSHMQRFDQSQRAWVDGVSDVASVTAALGAAALAPVTGGASLAVGAAAGAFTKVGTKGLEALTGGTGYQGDPMIDLVKGTLNGGSGVGSNMLAQAASKRLLAGATARLAGQPTALMLTRGSIYSGVAVGEGMVDGLVVGTGGALIDGKPVDEAALEGLRGAAFGAVLNPIGQGAFAGFGRLRRSIRPDAPATPPGVDLPELRPSTRTEAPFNARPFEAPTDAIDGRTLRNPARPHGRRAPTGADPAPRMLTEAEARKVYDAVRASTDDIDRIVKNTGMPRNVIERVRKHVFVDEHALPLGPNDVVRMNFTPDEEIARLWRNAMDGKLTSPDRAQFERLLSHEYVESMLMEGGMPYRSANPAAWENLDGAGWTHMPVEGHLGAHDVSPLVDASRSPFQHYRRLGLDPSRIPFGDNPLDNLDAVVAEISRQLGRGPP